jgi:hypothetical protein
MRVTSRRRTSSASRATDAFDRWLAARRAREPARYVARQDVHAAAGAIAHRHSPTMRVSLERDRLFRSIVTTRFSSS